MARTTMPRNPPASMSLSPHTFPRIIGKGNFLPVRGCHPEIKERLADIRSFQSRYQFLHFLHCRHFQRPGICPCKQFFLLCQRVGSGTDIQIVPKRRIVDMAFDRIKSYRTQFLRMLCPGCLHRFFPFRVQSTGSRFFQNPFSQSIHRPSWDALGGAKTLISVIGSCPGNFTPAFSVRMDADFRILKRKVGIYRILRIPAIHQFHPRTLRLRHFAFEHVFPIGNHRGIFAPSKEGTSTVPFIV